MECILIGLEFIGLITGLMGQWLVAQRKRSAFVVWSISNMAIIWVQFMKGTYLLTAMFMAYLGLCAYAYVSWGKQEPGIVKGGA